MSGRITPYSTIWRKHADQLARDYAPPIHPCGKCSYPVLSGYCCTFCGDVDPASADRGAASNAAGGGVMCSRCESVPNLLLQLCRQMDNESRTVTRERIDKFMEAMRAAANLLYLPDAEAEE